MLQDISYNATVITRAFGGTQTVGIAWASHVKIVPSSTEVKRITSRPWSCDPYLQQTVSRLVLGKKSVGTTIEHSELLKRVFGDYVRRSKQQNKLHPLSQSSRGVTNLRACKVRFESCTRPMGRFILWFPAVMATLIYILTTRSGRPEAKRAAECLELIDNERVVTLAMLADAGDEALMVARFFDTEKHDVSRTYQVLDTFRARIDYLFLQGNCKNLGFTKFAIQALQQNYTFVVKGSVRGIGGGISNTVFVRALNRLKVWVGLAIATVRSEIPEWDITQLFSVLDMSLQGTGSDRRTGPARQLNIDRLSNLLTLPTSKLTAELSHVLPVALQLQSEGSYSNIEVCSLLTLMCAHFQNIEHGCVRGVL